MRGLIVGLAAVLFCEQAHGDMGVIHQNQWLTVVGVFTLTIVVQVTVATLTIRMVEHAVLTHPYGA